MLTMCPLIATPSQIARFAALKWSGFFTCIQTATASAAAETTFFHRVPDNRLIRPSIRVFIVGVVNVDAHFLRRASPRISPWARIFSMRGWFLR